MDLPFCNAARIYLSPQIAIRLTFWQRAPLHCAYQRLGGAGRAHYLAGYKVGSVRMRGTVTPATQEYGSLFGNGYIADVQAY